MADHWARRESHFTKTHEPLALHMVWLAASTAVEGYVFLFLPSTMPRDCIQQLGGWTQTSANASPLSTEVFEQERRLMRGLCFNCGGNHFASSCDKPITGVRYPRGECGAAIIITSCAQSARSQPGATQAAAGASPVLPRSSLPRSLQEARSGGVQAAGPPLSRHHRRAELAAPRRCAAATTRRCRGSSAGRTVAQVWAKKLARAAPQMPSSWTVAIAGRCPCRALLPHRLARRRSCCPIGDAHQRLGP